MDGKDAFLFPWPLLSIAISIRYLRLSKTGTPIRLVRGFSRAVTHMEMTKSM